jgi:hypothetical protein
MLRDNFALPRPVVELGNVKEQVTPMTNSFSKEMGFGL